MHGGIRLDEYKDSPRRLFLFVLTNWAKDKELFLKLCQVFQEAVLW